MAPADATGREGPQASPNCPPEITPEPQLLSMGESASPNPAKANKSLGAILPGFWPPAQKVLNS